tara:strand:+ start:937 stop:1410 length:474 start_codon:yes stop_codon:yes gene_type:complete
MKKFSAILIIITSFLSLIITFNVQHFYGEPFSWLGYFTQASIVVSALSSIAFILLGFALLKEGNSSDSIQSETTVSQDDLNPTMSQADLNPNDVPSTGLNIISFLIPIVGLIIYLTEKDKAPKKASSAGKSALWGVGISILLGVISVIISLVFISNM